MALIKDQAALLAQPLQHGIGARQDGVLRNHRRLADGRLDHTVMYSITDSEWPQVKAGLESRFGA